MKISKQVRAQAVELLLCAADLRIRPADSRADYHYPCINAGVDLFVRPFHGADVLAYAARVSVLEDMGCDRFDWKLNDEFVILEAAKRLEEGWCPQ